MKRYHASPILWLDKMYNRLTRIDDGGEAAKLDAQIRSGLRPAPELREIVEMIVAALRSGGVAGEGGGGQGEAAGIAGFNCLQVTQADLSKNGERIFVLGSRLMSASVPTLLADASLGTRAQAHMRATFARPVFLSALLHSLLSPAQRALLHDKVPGSGPGAGAAHRPNLAYELVELHVCARAQEFSGNMLTPYAHAVCYERDGVLAGSASATGVDVRRQCRDLYSRDEVSIKASRAGRAWF